MMARNWVTSTAGYRREFIGQALLLIRRDAWVYAVTALYTAVCFTVMHSLGRFQVDLHQSYMTTFSFSLLCAGSALSITVCLIRIMFRFGERRFRAYRRVFNAQRMAYLLAGIAAMMGLVVFQATFTSFKNLFPLFHDGFPYDRLQADIDEWLHFGHAPSALVYDSPIGAWAFKALEWNYGLGWLFLCYGGLYLVSTWSKLRAIRTRYFLMSFFVWGICGTLVAGTFLSAGPVFYGPVTGDFGRFGHVVDAVAATSPDGTTRMFQIYLWDLYEAGTARLGTGISAFPSVHVAVATMNALFLAERSRFLACVGISYAAVILFSSVLLGWHYAIDGYASILLVVCAHFALRHFFRRKAGQSERSVYCHPVAVAAK